MSIHKTQLNQPAEVAYSPKEGYLIRLDVPGCSEGDVSVRYEKGFIRFDVKRPKPSYSDEFQVLTGINYDTKPIVLTIGDATDLDLDSAKMELKSGSLLLKIPLSNAGKPRAFTFSRI